MTRPRRLALCYVTPLLVVAACGNDPSPAAGGTDADAGTAFSTWAPAEAPKVDPCLLSDEEMAGLLNDQLPSNEGAITVTSDSTSLGSGDTCTYSWTRETWGEGAGKEFTIDVFPAAELDLAAGDYERTPIEDAGDEAFETMDNYYARVGDVVVHLVNLQETPEASVAVLQAAAGNV